MALRLDWPGQTEATVMKSYVKVILVVAVFALWVALAQFSPDSGTAATGGGCGCGGGTCPVAPPADSKK